MFYNFVIIWLKKQAKPQFTCLKRIIHISLYHVYYIQIKRQTGLVQVLHFFTQNRKKLTNQKLKVYTNDRSCLLLDVSIQNLKV